ncbi:MAG: NAD(+) synthase, partial [Duncaniella sp.]|nr:NAD(+) synthase [Duncaniella sp.]
MHNGFLRVASCAPHVKVADVEYNLAQIIKHLDLLAESKVELAVFPEMSLTAYTCADLFHNRTLLDAAHKALSRLR